MRPRSLAARWAAVAALLAVVAPAAAAAQVTTRRDSLPPVALRPLEVTARKHLRLTGRFRPIRRAGQTVARADGRPRAIAVHGTFANPGFCQELGAAADRTGPVVTLVVEARGAASRCSVAFRAATYAVTLHDLPAGTFTVRVFHAWRNRPGQREMTLDTAVVVR
ncbi:MAG TPA: hypothetical protein VFJ16_10415 [Longimicrobium sp.]|nr:hypothetical protein [Longimicrobium sp.]